MKNKRNILIIFLLTISFVSCRNHDETLIIKKLAKYNQIDLSVLCNQKFDCLIILDEGTTLEQYDIQNLSEQKWLGQKIIFVKNNEIVKQVNLSYYVSEPKKNYYLSFFYEVKPSDKYIKRNFNDCVFSIISKQQIGENSICYYLQ